MRKERQLTDEEMDAYLEKIDMSLDLTKQIDHLKKNWDEVGYFTDTADILYQYYNLVESGGVAEDMQDSTKKVNSILKYFTSPSPALESTSVQKAPEESKTSLMERYLKCTDKDHIRDMKNSDENECPNCGSANVTLVTNDGYTFCHECDCIEYIIIDHEKPSYREPPKEISYYTYKRINHFKLEWKSECCLLVVTPVKGPRRHAQIAGSPDTMHSSPIIKGKRMSVFRSGDPQPRPLGGHGSETRWVWLRRQMTSRLRYSPARSEDDWCNATSGFLRFKARRRRRFQRRFTTRFSLRSRSNGSLTWPL